PHRSPTDIQENTSGPGRVGDVDRIVPPTKNPLTQPLAPRASPACPQDWDPPGDSPSAAVASPNGGSAAARVSSGRRASPARAIVDSSTGPRANGASLVPGESDGVFGCCGEPSRPRADLPRDSIFVQRPEVQLRPPDPGPGRVRGMRIVGG